MTRFGSTQGKLSNSRAKFQVAAFFISLNVLSIFNTNAIAESVEFLNKINQTANNNTLSPLATTNPSLNSDLYGNGTLLSEFTSWGISPYNDTASIHLPLAWKNFQKIKSVVVAVIDTGIDPQHPFLKNNIYVKSGNVGPENFGVDFSKFRTNDKKPEDSHGHGTHVSGIIRSIFPEVQILALKYYSTHPKATGQDNLDSTIEALRYAVDSNVDVINYSGGGAEPSIEELKILTEAQRKGIIVVAAAGNEESNIDNKKNAYFPASYRLTNIITVTANDQDLSIIPSSNYGANTVDISAPGYRIRSSFPNARAVYLTGTSQATAFVSGVVALLKSQFPNISVAQVKEVLMASAHKVDSMKAKCLAGGTLDAGAALALAKAKFSDNAEGSRTVAEENKKKMLNSRGKRPGKIIYRRSK
ncbi:MAG: hypothetical protein A2504_03380 [Bdellovibrionales bacterium RIFOXYD12_FULL_39_22]|nr:MAG: hypothetical protein A2385_15790 [Bdellovibrionales bacterium RIFOXYB1_FULL_39_21]OFZ41566.1 MAG: hypothetical protein A2485_02480 [Bdellovibrionales bacterium RIFOXYC12_FULL_39_17]OFZ45879.1 MAG: hypothetical protein A2404_12845 [Bdellovibrionales bacterium RIFOXYC1_FULL_39_130]OFZ74811.1 MAG: hypothetical protein A2560_10275 [Bdellovibrionales bacterium RIFOXYD1_FULL_39_84]OFZ92671.1 MAG: hypothetical protein A2504_03380 [Bdellovibrionales bacterium RIFOXYD12_FULL_39_22]